MGNYSQHIFESDFFAPSFSIVSIAVTNIQVYALAQHVLKDAVTKAESLKHLS